MNRSWAVVLLGVLAAGCASSRDRAPVDAPPPMPTPEVTSNEAQPEVTRPDPPVADPRPTAAELLTNADRLLLAGDPRRAADAYRAVLNAEGAASSGDRALLQLATIHLAAEGPLRSVDSATRHLRQLVTAYPTSPLAPTARAILALLSSNRDLAKDRARLAQQVEALKRIDLAPPRRP